MSTDWFCRIDDEEFGPLTSKGLREMAAKGRLTRDHQVRKGPDGQWIFAEELKGLFNGSRNAIAVRPAQNEFGRLVDEDRERDPTSLGKTMQGIQSVKQCISAEEKKQRLGVMVVNGLIWILLCVPVLATAGVILIFYGIGWLMRRLFSEYNVRKLQAYGTTATQEQFPEVHDALTGICAQFGVKSTPKVIVLNDRSFNAFALRFAQRKVIVLLSETLEGVLHKPQELRFILGHEMAHIVLDHGVRGAFEIYKPAKYKAGRELTCDNCGCVCAGDLDASKTALKRLGAGNALHPKLNEEYLEREAEYLYSGLSGWFLQRHLTHPPLGKRLVNVAAFSASRFG